MEKEEYDIGMVIMIIPISMSHYVDWDPARLTINRLPAGLKRFFHKFSTGNIGNRYMLCKRNEIESPRCLLCNHDVEKSSHVLLCNNDETKNKFKKLTKSNLEKALTEQQTSPDLQNAMITILGKYREGRTITIGDFSQAFGLRQAIEEQDKGLGWNNFLLGRWSPRWQTVQKRYLRSIRNK